MKTTNQRIIITTGNAIDGELLSVHEVTYEDGKPVSFCAAPTVLQGADIGEVLEIQRDISSAYGMPALTEQDFPAGRAAAAVNTLREVAVAV